MSTCNSNTERKWVSSQRRVLRGLMGFFGTRIRFTNKRSVEDVLRKYPPNSRRITTAEIHFVIDDKVHGCLTLRRLHLYKSTGDPTEVILSVVPCLHGARQSILINSCVVQKIKSHGDFITTRSSGICAKIKDKFWKALLTTKAGH